MKLPLTPGFEMGDDYTINVVNERRIFEGDFKSYGIPDGEYFVICELISDLSGFPTIIGYLLEARDGPIQYYTCL